ncbi:MAG TPA: response regulator transcription factor [Acidimicrobiia bacterium]|jgi:DNA-binding NarL/FixJ family response regulator|nr:response regulator transcription factor [Acidimicrobiia bacterium]
MSDTINVLVVDDQALVRAGFAMILETEPGIEVVGEAADGDEAFALAQELMPDVVLMDIRMPKVDGLEATRRIRNELADPPRVLMLTTFDLDEYVYDALRNGASGFLLKDTPPEDLVAAIRVIAQGEALLAPSVTTRLINEFASRPARPSPHPGLNDLTERETEVLRHLARGMSNSEVADALFVSEATVKSHISHILTKLALRDRVQAVVVAYESGLVTPGGS